VVWCSSLPGGHQRVLSVQELILKMIFIVAIAIWISPSRNRVNCQQAPVEAGNLQQMRTNTMMN
jgi:hypothetical protein